MTFEEVQQKREEQELIRAYRCLNSDGKWMLIQNARILAHSERTRLYVPKDVKEPIKPPEDWMKP